MLSGFAKPLCRLAIFLWNTKTSLVAHAEVTLRNAVVLIGSLAKPFHGFAVILLDALAVLVTDTEIALRLRVAFFGGSPHFLERLPRATAFLHAQMQA